jgi:hypothetical protein
MSAPYWTLAALLMLCAGTLLAVAVAWAYYGDAISAIYSNKRN